MPAKKKQDPRGELRCSFEVNFFENAIEVSIFNPSVLSESMIDQAPLHIARELQRKRAELWADQRAIDEERREIELEADRQKEKELEDA